MTRERARRGAGSPGRGDRSGVEPRAPAVGTGDAADADAVGTNGAARAVVDGTDSAAPPVVTPA
jgi:hypothetical protein